MGGRDRLETVPAAEKHRQTLINQQHDRSFPFLAKELGMGFTGLGGNPPVDTADIITGMVGPHLFKFDAPSSESGLVGANQLAEYLALSAKFELTGAVSESDQLWQFAIGANRGCSSGCFHLVR